LSLSSFSILGFLSFGLSFTGLCFYWRFDLLRLRGLLICSFWGFFNGFGCLCLFLGIAAFLFWLSLTAWFLLGRLLSLFWGFFLFVYFASFYSIHFLLCSFLLRGLFLGLFWLFSDRFLLTWRNVFSGSIGLLLDFGCLGLAIIFVCSFLVFLGSWTLNCKPEAQE
jgi:hypothetical protein